MEMEKTGMLRTLVILSGLVLSGSVFAHTQNQLSSDYHFVIGITPSLDWINSNKQQTFFLQPDVENTYTADNNTTWFPGGELFFGYQLPMLTSIAQQPVITELGLSLVAAGNAKLSGDVWADANPAFNNYTYNYKISHTHIALKGRLISNAHMFVDPYISANIGVGFNRAYEFGIQSDIYGEIAPPAFKSNTTTTFVGGVGIGVQKSLTTNLQVALGYEFADWGKTQLARANGQTLNQGLTLNNLYSNQLQLSLFYIF
jgi:opacity protein-like surface antigen